MTSPTQPKRAQSRFAATILVVLAIFVATLTSSSESALADEPNVETELRWLTPQQNVWTPIGWKEHLHRFQVVYNGYLLVNPASKLLKPHTKRFADRQFQLNAYTSPDGKLPPMPTGDQKLKLIDGGLG